jgi:hypothetical protein
LAKFACENVSDKSTQQSLKCTGLGHLGQHDTDRVISISIAFMKFHIKKEFTGFKWCSTVGDRITQQWMKENKFFLFNIDPLREFNWNNETCFWMISVTWTKVKCKKPHHFYLRTPSYSTRAKILQLVTTALRHLTYWQPVQHIDTELQLYSRVDNTLSWVSLYWVLL